MSNWTCEKCGSTVTNSVMTCGECFSIRQLEAPYTTRVAMMNIAWPVDT